MENILQITRHVEIARPTLDAPLPEYQTNQMYIFNLSSSLGVECWNSYATNYAGPIQIAARDVLTVDFTNAAGNSVSPFPSVFQSIPNVSTQFMVWSNTLNPLLENRWANGVPNSYSFIIPLNTNVAFLTNADFLIGASQFIPATTNYPEIGVQPLPQLGLLATNRLQVFILNGTNVIDYVQFAGPSSSYNINSALADPDSKGDILYQWSTNFPNNNAASGLPYGVANQITVSTIGPSAVPSTDIGQWDQTYGAEEVPHFKAFFSANHIVVDPANGVAVSNLDLQAQTPYTPTRTIIEYTSLQANDPLVHYMADDLNFSGTETGNRIETGIHQWNNESDLPANRLGTLNDRYQPWGRSLASTNSTGYNLTIKDPLVYFSDDWNFPNGQTTNLDWLGRVHRGTPWQTIYLKSSDVSLATWTNWMEDADPADAASMKPTQDRSVVSVLLLLLNTNDLRSRLSINNPDTNAWQSSLDGLTAWTNSLSPSGFYAIVPGRQPAFDTIIISSNSSQANILAEAIQSARVTQSGQFFRNVGDILAAPQLTEQSPFLNESSSQITNGITDEAFEKIPAQLLPLLRADSIGSTTINNNQIVVQFSGYDNHPYIIQVSSDLVNWTNVSTNYPINGTFGFTNAAAINVFPQFYHSILQQ